MAIPTSPPWDLANLDESTIASFLGLGPSDLSLTPAGAPYFTYDAAGNFITVQSEDGVSATADLNVAVPSQYTMEITVRFPRLPDHAGDVATHRLGLTLADDSGRGASIYFSKNGLAVSRIDDFGSVAPIPDSTDDVREIDTFFHTIRIAIDSGLGRAYVFIGDARDSFLPLRYILPVEATPGGVIDTFRLFALGTSTDPAQMEITHLRLASSLIIGNIPPTADPGQDRVVPVGQAARLNGRASFDVEGALLTYQWQAVDAPFGSQFAHDNSGGSSTDDGDADGFTTILTFTATSLPPWVVAGDVLLISGVRHVITTVDNFGGSLTVGTDTIPDSLSVVPFRIIRQSLIVGATTETPHVVPDIEGLYRFSLVVNDGEADSESAEVLVSVVGARAPFGVEPAIEFFWDALGDEWNFIENRTVFQEFWRGTAQLLGGKLLEAWQYHYNFNIGDAQRTFQRKWMAYRTLITETGPDDAAISPRYGAVLATHDFSDGDPTVTGLTLIIEYADDDSSTNTVTVTTTFTADDLTTIAADLTTALAGSSLTAEAILSGATLRIDSTIKAFKILSTSTAAVALGLTTDKYNYLEGIGGARVTDRTYRVDPGIDLLAHGVSREDLLVLNNGQSFRIDRVLDNASDPTSNQRLLLFKPLPFDATPEWEIPSVVRSTEIDYEREGSYPGDLVKAEAFDVNTSATTDLLGTVVAQKGKQVAARLDGFFSSLLDTERYDIRLLGVKRRKALVLDQEIVSIPQLQDKIAQSAGPTLYKQNIDYYLEPFYREDDETALNMLQFRDSIFIDPDLEPPDIFWAEVTLFSNEGNIENLFGRLVGFLRKDATTFGDDFSYASAVAGLLYAHQRGPAIRILKTGTQILFGQPFAEVRGTITEIRNDFTPTTSRVLVQDDDGFSPVASEVIRSYVYQKDPLDLLATSGLELNPATDLPYAVGDTISQFAPIGTGVDILDYINDPDWFVPFLRSGILSEIEKFHSWVVGFNLDLVNLVGLTLAQQFLLKVKPTYTYPILLGIKNLQEDVDIVDVLELDLTMHLVDSFCDDGRAYMYDDYRGDGTTWSHYGDGTSEFSPLIPPPTVSGSGFYYDGLVDCVSDHITLCLMLEWADYAAEIEGSGDLSVATYPGDFSGRTLSLNVDGTIYNTVFTGASASLATMLGEINTVLGANGTASSGGVPATGLILTVAGGSLTDGTNIILDDGVNPAVTFEFDDDSSVVETATLRQVVFAPGDSDDTVRDTLMAAIFNAPTLDISAISAGSASINLQNNLGGTAGNVTITTTSACTVLGMVGGTDTLVVVSATTGIASYVEVEQATTAALFTVFGFTSGLDFNARIIGTQDLSAAAYPGDFSGRTLQVIVDGGAPVNVVFSGSVASATDVRDEINTAVGSTVAAIDSLSRLIVFSNTVGVTSEMEIGAGTTAALLTVIGLTASVPVFGDMYTTRAYGNVITNSANFFYDTLVEEGTIAGSPPVFTPSGGTFFPTYDLPLLAGDYQVCVVIDSGNDVLP